MCLWSTPLPPPPRDSLCSVYNFRAWTPSPVALGAGCSGVHKADQVPPCLPSCPLHAEAGEGGGQMTNRGAARVP